MAFVLRASALVFLFATMASADPSRESREIQAIQDRVRHDAFAQRPRITMPRFESLNAKSTLEDDLLPVPKPEREFDAISYVLHFDFPAASLLQPQFDAEAELTFNPGKTGFQLLRLDSSGLKIKKVMLLNRFEQLRFQQKDESLEIDLGAQYSPRDTLTVQIQYSWAQKPNQGIYFRSRRAGTPAEAIYSQSEPDESKLWFPGDGWPNDRASIETYVSVPKPLEALSNGALLDVKEQGDSRVFHWKMTMPMASYLYVVTAGRFGIDRKQWRVPGTDREIPLLGYGPSDDMDRVAHTLRNTGEVLGFLSERTGTPYPYEKYAQAFVPQYFAGGMEHTTATTLTDRNLHSEAEDEQYEGDSLIAHEAAHQWFGDLVTCKSWDELWLNEGFATYFDDLHQEHALGKDALMATLADAARWHFADVKENGDRPVVFPYYSDDLGYYFGSHSYGKGSLVLHMLRDRLGDDAFFAGIALYLKTNRGRLVETADFRRAMETASDVDLGYFFDQWIFKPGYPQFQVSWSYDLLARSLSLRVKQTQDTTKPGGKAGTTPLFQGPISVEVDGIVHRIELAGKETETFRLPAENPEYVKFNSGNAWLSQVSTQQSPQAWMAQLTKSTDAAARAEAASMLKLDPLDKDGSKAMVALANCIAQDPSLYARVSCARAIEDAGRRAVAARADATITLGLATLGKVLGSPKAAPLDLRQAAAAALPGFGTRALPVIQSALATETSAHALAWLAEALSALAPDPAAYETLLPLAGRDTYEDVLRKAALEGLLEYSDVRSLDTAMKYSKVDAWGDTEWGLKTRQLAFTLVARIGKKHPEVAEPSRLVLESTLTDRSATIRRAAATALGALGNPAAIARLREVASQDEDAGVRRAAQAAIEILTRPEATR